MNKYPDMVSPTPDIEYIINIEVGIMSYLGLMAGPRNWLYRRLFGMLPDGGCHGNC